MPPNDNDNNRLKRITPQRERQILEAYQKGRARSGMSQDERKAEARLQALLEQQEALAREREDQDRRIREGIATDPGEIADWQDAHNAAVQENSSNLVAATEDFQKKQSFRQARIQKRLVTSTETATGERATREDISAVTRSKYTIAEQMRRTKAMSPFEVEDELTKQKEEIAKSGAAAREHSEFITEPGRKEAYKEEMEKLAAAKQEAGILEGVAKRQHALGLDPLSQHKRGAQIRDQVEREQEARGVKRDAEEGKIGTVQETGNRLDEVSRSFIDTMSKFEAALEDGSDAAREEATKLGKSLGELEKEYRKASAEFREAQRLDKQSGMKGILGSGLIGGVGAILQGTGAVTRMLGVTTEMQQTQVKMGMAEEANLQYFDKKAAAAGDMSAIRRVLSDQAAQGAARADTLGTVEQAALVQEAAGLAAGGIESTIMGVMQGAQGGGVIGGIAGGLKAGAQSAVAVTGKAADIGKGISVGQTELAAAKQLRAYQDILSRIDDASGQNVIDYSKAMAIATRGAGVGPVDAATYGRVVTEAEKLEERDGRRIGDFGGREAYRQIEHGTASQNFAMEQLRQQATPATSRTERTVIPPAPRAPTTFDDNLASDSMFERELETREPTVTTRTIDTSANIVTADDIKALQRRTGGGRREQLLEDFTSEEGAKKLALEAGLKQEDVPRLVGQAVQQLGGEFEREDIVTAGKRQRAGYMTAEQYIGARAQISDVAATADSNQVLSDILKDAITVGMDNSKNLGQMVSGITELASRSAAGGIDTTVGLAQGMGFAATQLVEGGMNRNVAAMVARTAAAAGEEAGGNYNETLSNMIRAKRMRTHFAGRDDISATEKAVMERMTPAEYRSLLETGQVREGETQEQADARFEREKIKHGLGGSISRRDIEEGQKAAREDVLREGLGFLGSAQLRKSILAKAEAGKDFSALTKEEQAEFNATTRIIKGKEISGEAYYNYVSGRTTRELTEDEKRRQAEKEARKTGEQPPVKDGVVEIVGGLTQAFENIKDMGQAVTSLQEFGQGLKLIKENAGGLEALSEIMIKIAGATKPGDATDVTIAAGKEQKLPASVFAKAEESFSKTVKEDFTKAVNLFLEANKERSNKVKAINPVADGNEYTVDDNQD